MDQAKRALRAIGLGAGIFAAVAGICYVFARRAMAHPTAASVLLAVILMLAGAVLLIGLLLRSMTSSVNATRYEPAAPPAPPEQSMPEAISFQPRQGWQAPPFTVGTPETEESPAPEPAPAGDVMGIDERVCAYSKCRRALSDDPWGLQIKSPDGDDDGMIYCCSKVCLEFAQAEHRDQHAA
jgi:hypothetical protein